MYCLFLFLQPWDSYPDITKFTYDPISKVMQIRGTEYDWKNNKNYTGHDIGVIAQDVEKVLPEAVSTKPDGTKGVHYNKLIPLLIEAVKDLSQQVDDIKDK